MNKISWEEREKEMDANLKEENLKNSKRGSIFFIKDLDKLGNWHLYHYHWEKWLTTNYWKDWQEKINNFQSIEEVNFYTSRLRVLMNFVEDYTKKDVHCLLEGEKPWDPVNTPKLIEQELKRLENISKEEFIKTDKWERSKIEFKELSVQEALNDPWFSNEINKLFDLKNGKLPKKKKTEQQERDTSVYSSCKGNGSLSIFANEVNFNKFYKEKINQFQAGIDYNTNKEKSIYSIFSNQLKKDILISQNDFNSNINVDDIRSMKIILNKNYWEEKKLNDNQDNNQSNKDKESDTNYQNWNREKIVSSINLLKAENEELKNDQNLFLTSSEREEILQKNQSKLEQLQNILHSLDNNNSLPIPAVIGIVGVVFLVSLVAYKKVVRKKRF